MHFYASPTPLRLCLSPCPSTRLAKFPYILKKLEFSKQIELVANPSYFEHKAKIDTIIFHVIADSMTRFLMLKNGEIDVDSLEPMQYER